MLVLQLHFMNYVALKLHPLLWMVLVVATIRPVLFTAYYSSVLSVVFIILRENHISGLCICHAASQQ